MAEDDGNIAVGSADSTTRPVELAKCLADSAYFTHHYGIIDDAQGNGSGTMPFHLWPAQTHVLWSLMLHRLTIILKARQLGISWLCCSYALWLCLFHPGKVVLLFSKGQSEANELLRRIKVLYQRLPEWMREALPTLSKDNTSEVGWSNESRIQSLPATQSAGRSLTASLVVMDEAAFLMWAGELFTAVKPTIDNGGQLIILSTANGIGNLFHLLWTNAVASRNTFKTIFLPWWARPGRDKAWYQRQLTEYTDPKMVRQEYPSSATEAFLVSGRTRFQQEWIERQVAGTCLPVPAELKHIPNLSLYKLPDPSRRYVLGADVAEGLESGDFSAAVMIDAESWEEMGCLHGHWEPDEYAGYLQTLAEFYKAEIAPERNNHGHAVLSTLKANGYRRVAEGADGKLGWLTNAQTKPQVIDLLATALRDDLCKVRTQAAIDELLIYRIDDKGGTGAPSSYHDDLVMAWAIAISVARRPSTVKAEVMKNPFYSSKKRHKPSVWDTPIKEHL